MNTCEYDFIIRDLDENESDYEIEDDNGFLILHTHKE